MFKSIYNHGFHIIFENGITISVQFGRSNYCERRSLTGNSLSSLNSDLTEPIVYSNSAEIAIWDKDGKNYNFINDSVMGWCDAYTVGHFIDQVRKAKTLDDIKSM